MRPRTIDEYLDSTRNILEEAARLLGQHGHSEMSVYASNELRRAEQCNIEDEVGADAQILILAGASLLVRKYAEKNDLADVTEVMNQWDDVPSAG